jgi:hypothetical protein
MSLAESSPIRVESNRLVFEMANGKDVKLPAHYATFHDQTGSVLPKCDVFFGPWKRRRGKAEMGRVHRRYFGADHQAKLADIGEIPIDGWKPIGKVHQILYVRRGTRAPGGYHHKFATDFAWFFKVNQPTFFTQVDQGRRLYKMSLGKDCLVDDRGFVFP